jgi:hypothetical protein
MGVARSRWMWWAALVLFAGYVGLVIVAGAWGAFGPARLDQRWLFDLEVDGMDGTAAASLLSQYRFLRAIELGYGLVAARCWRQIFSDRRFGGPFLLVMGLGVAARVAGLAWDGSPGPLFWFFLVTEAIGVAVIWFVARPRWADLAAVA